MTTKFILIETWNGEGYCTENTAKIVHLTSSCIKAMLNDIIDSLMQNHYEVTAYKLSSDGFSINYSAADDGDGTYKLRPFVDGDYGVVIRCNINEADVLDWIHYQTMLASAIQQSHPLDEIDEDDPFIGAHNGDYDYQFIKL